MIALSYDPLTFCAVPQPGSAADEPMQINPGSIDLAAGIGVIGNGHSAPGMTGYNLYVRPGDAGEPAVRECPENYFIVFIALISASRMALSPVVRIISLIIGSLAQCVHAEVGDSFIDIRFGIIHSRLGTE
jgi:hypothetical protein